MSPRRRHSERPAPGNSRGAFHFHAQEVAAMPETLREKQSRFVRMLNDLLTWAHARGYEFTIGDAYRDPRVFGNVGEARGYGAPSSCHKSRLAVDLNLFRDGKFLESSDDHRPVGEYWESIGGTWGGRFQDGNHYSLEHNGRK